MNRAEIVWASLYVVAVCPVAIKAEDSAKGIWKPVSGGLMTKWAAGVAPDATLPEYPRPQMTRSEWQNLNGLWDYALADKVAPAPPAVYSGKILLPFPMESALSGVKKPARSDQRLWYHRVFTVPAHWAGKRARLCFGAVNWDSVVWLNGKKIGTHRGGYDGFEFDITESLGASANDLVVSTWNPALADVRDAQVLGKQRLKPGGIFYTPATGIWQTVWLEPVPDAHVTALAVHCHDTLGGQGIDVGITAE